MCQLQHPNIVAAEDVYLPSDIPVERRDSAFLQMQRSSADHICVRMPYYPADMAWLIHSCTQVLTPEHVQVMRAHVTQHRLYDPESACSDAVLQFICVQILRGLRCCPQAAHAPDGSALRPPPDAFLIGCNQRLCGNLFLFRYLHAAEVIHRDLKPSNM
jgi:serine/threonine protein kinase